MQVAVGPAAKNHSAIKVSAASRKPWPGGNSRGIKLERTAPERPLRLLIYETVGATYLRNDQSVSLWMFASVARMLQQRAGWSVEMRAILEHCSGGREIRPSANTLLIREGERTGHLYVLIEGSLEVLKGDTVVAVTAEPGAIFGEMSVLLGRPHSATVRATSASRVYEFDDAASFLRSQPEIALLVAELLAHRLSAATTYLADIKQQYAGQGNHLAMVGEILESLVSLSPTAVSPGSDREPDPRL